MGVSPTIADAESSLFKGDGGQKQTTNQTQTSTPFQQEQYKNLTGAADAWLASGGYDKTYAGGMDTVANMTPEQQQALANQVGLSGQLGSIFGTQGTAALTDYLGAYDPTKTGLSAAIDAANARSNYNFETQVNPQIRQGAQGAGQYGSSRHGIAEGLARGQLADSQQQTAAQLAFQDQQNFNSNRTNILNNLGGIAAGLNAPNDLRYQSGQLQQTQNQNEIQGLLDKWAYENNVDVNTLNAYKSLISGDMGGTTVTNATTKTSGGGGAGGWGALGSIGGALLGSFLGPMGTATGSQLGSMVGNQIGGGSTK